MPPSLEDVSNAIKYTVDVALNNSSYSAIQYVHKNSKGGYCLLYIHSAAKLDGCASKDVARAHVYEVAVKTAYAGAGEHNLPFAPSLSVHSLSIKEAAPAWFSPALRSLQRLEKTVAQVVHSSYCLYMAD